VQVLDMSGKFLRKFSVQRSGYPQLHGIALDAFGNVIVCVYDVGHNVEYFKADGTFVTAFGSKGTGFGQFTYPRVACVDRTGRIFIGDDTRVQVFTYSE
jgi:DNA-binding beta-propeller fold protein YncE